MENFNKNKDVTKIFNEQWSANHGNYEKIIQAKKDFNFKMFGIKEKEDIRKEVREYNSINSQVDRLNQRMNSSIPKGISIKSGFSMNQSKNNFR